YKKSVFEGLHVLCTAIDNLPDLRKERVLHTPHIRLHKLIEVKAFHTLCQPCTHLQRNDLLGYGIILGSIIEKQPFKHEDQHDKQQHINHIHFQMKKIKNCLHRLCYPVISSISRSTILVRHL